jgi:hypothetical protein
MRKIFMIVGILVITFIVGTMVAKVARAYSWKHIMGGGLYGSTGVALKVDADGALYIRD